MAWTYTDATALLVSAGATEASPDSLLAGIAIVQAANAARGYRNGNVAWLQDVEVRYGASAVIIDDDSCISMRGSAYLRPVNGAGGGAAVTIIHGNRSVFQIAGTAVRTDTAISFPAGSTVICRRARPQDPSPRIRHMGTVRNDYFSAAQGINLAKIDIAGIDIYLTSGLNFFKAYFARNGGTANVVQYKDVRVFGAINPQFFNSTYTTWYVESLNLSSESIAGTFTMDRPTYYLASPAAFNGDFRQAVAFLDNPTFLNNCWNGSVNFVASLNAASALSLRYSYINTFRAGLTPVGSVNVRFTRSRQSVNGAPTWTATDAVITAITNTQGQYTAVRLLDAYRAGTSTSDLERFNWTAKARKYDKRTAGETIFASRVLFQHSVNMSAGYSEEVQMLDVANLTLTQAQAAALTGISFAASGATGGTVTVTEPRTTAEVWAAYRNWISQTANFDSSDTWTFDGTTLNMGAWNLAGTGTAVGQFVTTGLITAPVDGVALDANNAGSIAVTGAAPTDTIELRDAGTGTLLATRTGPGSFAVPPASVGSSVYFRRLVGTELVMSTITAPLTLTAGVNADVPLFAGAQVQVAQAARIDLLPTAAEVWSATTRTLTSGGGSGGITAQEVWEYVSRTLTSGGSSGGVTLAEIEASTVLAKEATVASRASQASVTALGTPAQAAAVAALASATLTEHDATQTAIAALPAPLTSAQAQAAAAAALVAYDAVVPADLAGLATGAEVSAIPTNPVLATDARLDNLAALPGSIAGLATREQLVVVNAGVKAASNFVPHEADLPS